MAGLVFKQKKRNKFQKKASLKNRMKFSRDEISRLKSEIRDIKISEKSRENFFKSSIKNLIWEYRIEEKKIMRTRELGPFDKENAVKHLNEEKETLFNAMSDSFASHMKNYKNQQEKLSEELNRELMTMEIYKDRVKELSYSWAKTKRSSLTRKLLKDAKNNYKFAKQTTHSREEFLRIKRYFKNKIYKIITEFKVSNPDISNVNRKIRRMSTHKLNRLETPDDEKLYNLLLVVNENKYAGAKQITELKTELSDLKDQYTYIKGSVSNREKMKYATLSISSTAGKVTNISFIYAIRNGYFALMPLVLLGALAIFMTQIFFDYNTGFMSLFIDANNTNAHDIINQLKIPFDLMYKSTYGMLGILLSISITYSLATFYKINRVSAIVSTILVFLMMSPNFTQDFSVLGTQGMFVGIIVSVVTTKLFQIFSRSRLFNPIALRAYEKSLATAFVNAISIFIICMIFAGISVSILFLGEYIGPVKIFEEVISITSLYDLMLLAVQKPLVGIVTGPIGMPIVIMMWQFLWFFGIHASGLLATLVEPLQLQAIKENIDGTGENVFTKPFVDMFGQNGGSGATLALIVVVLLISRRFEWKTMARIAIIPALFGINEPILFGLPIILNPIFFISFILAPIAGIMIGYVATITGFIPYTTVTVPWIMPNIFGTFLSTGGSINAILVWIVGLTSQMFIYLPVVLIANKAIEKDVVREMIRIERRGLNRFRNAYEEEQETIKDEKNKELERQFDEKQKLNA
ncbi:PTS system, cellobiose-specific IIC component [Spiroplasma sp. TIUS-1]|uniref:PTS transporter subunit EIIC n=1 Tax=Spiroplasma sp. TIUS-1 TaxID=216963 RepID=UPI0013996B56|nr:PTS transporter subunit EIIC [Spiroplasma sp. TIUS-1]QHX36059.1 PTS system, cellobiose-specific IIC component [Spiroplasma sp. TIUS-1]